MHMRVVHSEVGGYGVLTSCEQSLLVQPIPQDGKGEVAKTCENDNDGNIDGERVHEELVIQSKEPSGEEVVQESENPAGPDGIIRADVGGNGELLREVNIREEERSEQRRKRAASRPVYKGMKQQLIAAVCVFLPSC